MTITEAAHLLRKQQRVVVEILRDVARGELDIPRTLASQSAAAADLMEKYADIPMSLADASLVDLATQLRSPRIATLDSDFHIYRWGRNRTFELVLEETA